MMTIECSTSLACEQVNQCDASAIRTCQSVAVGRYYHGEDTGAFERKRETERADLDEPDLDEY